jgi:cytochrome c oxidase subunit 2
MIDDSFRLFPERASRLAPSVDALYFFLLAIAAFFTTVIASLIVYFSVKYRRGNVAVDRTSSAHASGAMRLEIAWMAIPFLIAMIIFVWGAGLYFSQYRPPADAIEIRVVAKQWMWKFQHPDGRREIDVLHVPLGQSVKLVMISEDVIHSFFVPAFRTKRDVLPGRYSTCWFQATRTGEFHLFCAEYCGTNHSQMIGRVVVLEPADYQTWLAGGKVNEPPADAGQRLFGEFRCAACHVVGGMTTPCPPLVNLYGQQVTLTTGEKVTADDDYLRESILRPGAKVVAGYPPLMPSFDGQLDEEQLIQLMTYIKSLSMPAAAAGAAVNEAGRNE